MPKRLFSKPLSFYYINVENDFEIKIIKSDYDITIFIEDSAGNLYWGSFLFESEEQNDLDISCAKKANFINTNICKNIFYVKDCLEIKVMYSLYNELVFYDPAEFKEIDYKSTKGKYFIKIDKFNYFIRFNL